MLTPSLESKLDSLAEYTRDLRELHPRSLDAFRSDKMLRRYAERMLQMSIEASIQIGVETLALACFREPENYHDIFIVLGDHGVLSPRLVTSMTMLIELRNMLIYEQDAIDETTIYGALKKRVDDLAEYGQAVSAFARGEPVSPIEPLELETIEEE